MPVVVKFVLQSVTAKNAVAVVSKLRTNLELESLVGASHSVQEEEESLSQWMKTSAKVGECITLDAIKSGIRFQKITGDAWLKAINQPKSADGQKAVDLFVLLMIYDMANQKKTVTAFIHRRVKAQCINAQLIQAVFAVHGRALREYVKPLLSIAESLMRASAVPGAREVASELYGQIFKHFAEYEQQEVVGALVRCAFSHKNLHSRVPLDPMHVRLKRTRV
jgi:Fanconi anemia group D2 protein